MTKKIVAVSALIVVIAGGVFMTIRPHVGKPKPQKWIRQIRMDRIDRETLEVITLASEEWNALDPQNLKWKHPKTGKRTVTLIMTCESCGKQIPIPDYTDPSDRESSLAADRIYMCPVCGKHAFLNVEQ